MSKHHLYDENGQETARCVVFLDGYRGWVRELPARAYHSHGADCAPYRTEPVDYV